MPISSSFVERVIENEQVRGVAVTGSTDVGKAVAKIAGKNLKKTVIIVSHRINTLKFCDKVYSINKSTTKLTKI